MEDKLYNEIFFKPRFNMEFRKDSDTLIQHFTTHLQDDTCIYPSKIVDGHFVIDVPEEESHFWSPQLHMEIESITENKTIVKGLFGPKPQVWTLFMFIHFAVATAFIVFAVLAYSKWSLKENVFFPVVMLIVLPIVWVLLYFLGQVGKATGQQQMKALKAYVKSILQQINT